MMHQQSPDKLLNGSRFFSVVKTSLQNVLYKSVLIDTGQRANNDLINEFPEHVKRPFPPKNLKSHFSVKERLSVPPLSRSAGRAQQTQSLTRSALLVRNSAQILSSSSCKARGGRSSA